MVQVVGFFDLGVLGVLVLPIPVSLAFFFFFFILGTEYMMYFYEAMK